MRKRLDYYSDDDDRDVGQFDLPVHARLIVFCLSLWDRFRSGVGRVLFTIRRGIDEVLIRTIYSKHSEKMVRREVDDDQGYFSDNQQEDDQASRSDSFRVPIVARLIGFLFLPILIFRVALERIVRFFLETLRVRRIFDVVHLGIGIAVGTVQWLIDEVLVRTIYSQKTEEIVKARHGILARIDTAWNWFMATILSWSEASVVVRWLLFPVRAFLLSFAAVTEFLFVWLGTRAYRQLILVIPAIALAIPLCFCFVLIPLTSNESMSRTYLAAARKASMDENFDAARLFYRKVSILQSSNSAIWGLAMIAAEDGDFEEAYKNVQLLASADEPGLPSAHVWIAHAIAANRIDPKVEDPDELMKRHLEHALKLEPNNQLALSLKADSLLKSGDIEDSIATLESMAVKHKEDRINQNARLAIAYRQHGNVEEAALLIADSSEEYAKMFGEKKDLQVETFRRWSATVRIAGNIPEAIRIIELGLKQHPNHESLTLAFRDLYFDLIRTAAGDVPQTAAKQIEVAKRMMAMRPNDDRIPLWVAGLFSVESVKDDVWKLLQPSIDDDSASVEVLGRLAMASLNRNDNQTARKVYEKLIQRSPDRPVALNNLAWILAHNAPIDLDRALRLIDQALRMKPRDPHMHGTRGQILLKHERWEEAIEELEFAINGVPGIDEHHRSLALAYSKTGNEDLADQHRQIVSSNGK